MSPGWGQTTRVAKLGKNLVDGEGRPTTKQVRK